MSEGTDTLEKKVYLVGLRKEALHYIVNAKALFPARDLHTSDKIHILYEYQISVNRIFAEKIQGFVETEDSVIYYTALVNSEGKWVPETLWPGVRISSILHTGHPSEYADDLLDDLNEEDFDE